MTQLIGHQHRYDPDAGHVDPFTLDTTAATERVEHLAVATVGSHALILEINGNHYDLDPELTNALRRFLRTADQAVR